MAVPFVNYSYGHNIEMAKEDRERRRARRREAINGALDKAGDIVKGSIEAIGEVGEFIGEIKETAIDIIEDPRAIKTTLKEHSDELLEGLANTIAIADDIQGVFTGIDASDMASGMLSLVGLDDGVVGAFLQDVNESGLPFDTTILNPRGLVKGTVKKGLTKKIVQKQSRSVDDMVRPNITKVPPMAKWGKNTTQPEGQPPSKRRKTTDEDGNDGFASEFTGEAFGTDDILGVSETLDPELTGATMDDLTSRATGTSVAKATSKKRYTCEEKCAYGREMGEKCKGCRGYRPKKSCTKRRKKPSCYTKKSSYKKKCACKTSKKSAKKKTRKSTYSKSRSKTATKKKTTSKAAKPTAKSTRPPPKKYKVRGDEVIDA